MSKKIGLSFAGGGARGAYQIGAWKALKELGIVEKVDVITGASVGSLNAALFAMGDYDLAYDTWMSLQKDSLLTIEDNLLKRVFKEKLNFFNKGVYKTKQLLDKIDEVIDYDLVRTKNVIVATTHLGNKDSTFFDLIKTNYEHFFKANHQIRYNRLNELSNEEIRDILMASCAIPVAFQPVNVNGETFYDGGLLDNTPYQPHVDEKVDIILVIDLFKFSLTRKKEVEGIPIHTVVPSKGLRGVLDFTHKQIKRRFELGYKDTLEEFSKIVDEL